MDDYENIRRTIAEYAHYNDYKRVGDRREMIEKLANLWTEDGVFVPGSHNDPIVGHAALQAFFMSPVTSRPADQRLHATVNSIIDIDGDDARVISDVVVFAPDTTGWRLHEVAHYYDKLVRRGDRWLFSDRRVVLGQGENPWRDETALTT